MQEGHFSAPLSIILFAWTTHTAGKIGSPVIVAQGVGLRVSVANHIIVKLDILKEVTAKLAAILGLTLARAYHPAHRVVGSLCRAAATASSTPPGGGG